MTGGLPDLVWNEHEARLEWQPQQEEYADRLRIRYTHSYEIRATNSVWDDASYVCKWARMNLEDLDGMQLTALFKLRDAARMAEQVMK